ncbi:transcriptional regulator [Massilia forsythiae]|uniref:Transcriptional regulator n=1 Tax=Massilia forsythiae TaxID=2728020 RepID=A0A7Z2W025_9BURK|nr:sugar diacid recognition domain-containing protein [Massilia forsythiae]QJE02626.1 transcriptional regulator [Massilia forsythiae]
MTVLSSALARDIVTRTMRIIPFNVNVMDAHGVILASGDPERIGELHDGALLALAKRATVDIDAATAQRMHGARPGTNLPLVVDGQLCGAVGLSGAPEQVRQFGELVRLTAEMILEQAGLAGELQRDTRYREAFVLNLVRGDAGARPELQAWAARLGLDLGRVQQACLLTLDGAAPADLALAELARLQLELLARRPGLLSATVSAHELVMIEMLDDAPRAPGAGADAPDLPALPPLPARAALDAAARRLQALDTLVRPACRLPFTLGLGLALPGIDGAAVSYESARAAVRIGGRRHPQERHFSYDALALPVLLAGLDGGWRAAQLRRPLARLGRERNGALLRRTLEAWFANDESAAATAAALGIHRNTLDYRLRRIEQVTGLLLARSEDRLLLYVSALLSE